MRATILLTIAVLASAGCAEPPASPVARTEVAAVPVLSTEEAATAPAEKDVVDENGNQIYCVKRTPSQHLVFRDDNEATPSQPCPPSYVARGKGLPEMEIPYEYPEDQNDDGLVCVKQNANGSQIVKDNDASQPSQPCPPAFELEGSRSIYEQPPELAFDDVVEADRNENGAVCYILWENGNFIVRDDNAGTPSQPCPPSFTQYGVALVEK